MSTDRNQKRIEQMQRKKESLFDNSSQNLEKKKMDIENNLKKEEDIINTSSNILDSKSQINFSLLSFDKEYDDEIIEEESKKNNEVNINELEFNINNPINFENENNENEVEVNISNLDYELDYENNNNINEIEINPSSNEYAKKYLSSNTKSFISFNNNLISRVTIQNKKNTPSYIYALCPDLLNNNINNKEIISKNYAVNDIIKEENESDLRTFRCIHYKYNSSVTFSKSENMWNLMKI